LHDCWMSGVQWLFQRLCELSEGELDEQAIAECAGYNMVDIKEFHKVEAYAVLQFAKRIARHQHSLDMAALLRQREEIAKQKEIATQMRLVCEAAEEIVKDECFPDELAIALAELERALGECGNVSSSNSK
jgi:hypothetical protein